MGNGNLVTELRALSAEGELDTRTAVRLLLCAVADIYEGQNDLRKCMGTHNEIDALAARVENCEKTERGTGRAIITAIATGLLGVAAAGWALLAK